MAQENKGGGIIAAIVGFACGVGVGLLFAQKSGEETRQDIAELIKKGRQKGEELVQQGREKLGKATDRVKDQVTSEGGKEPFYESGKYT